MNTFDNSEFEAYKAEVQERWGKTDAYKEHSEKTKHYSKDKWNHLSGQMNSISHRVCSMHEKRSST